MHPLVMSKSGQVGGSPRRARRTTTLVLRSTSCHRSRPPAYERRALHRHRPGALPGSARRVVDHAGPGGPGTGAGPAGRGYGHFSSPDRVDSGKGQNRTLTPLWPPVFAGENDVSNEPGLDRQAGVLPLSDCFAEMGGIPEMTMAVSTLRPAMR